MDSAGLDIGEAMLRLPLMSSEVLIACLSARTNAGCLSVYTQCWLCKPTRHNDT